MFERKGRGQESRQAFQVLWALAGSPLPDFPISLGFWKVLWVPCEWSVAGEVETLWFVRKSFRSGAALIKCPFMSP